MPQSNRAFTLIELLVVIAIIAILAAILFPVFAQAKAAAKKTQALSNQKQVLLGLQMYTTGYDDQLPYQQAFFLDSAGFRQSMWQSDIYPYLKSGKTGDPSIIGGVDGISGVYSDPAYPKPRQNNQFAPHYFAMPQGYRFWTPTATIPSTLNMGTLDRPSDFLLLVNKGVLTNRDWNYPYYAPDQAYWTGRVLDSAGNYMGRQAQIDTLLDNDQAIDGSGGTWPSGAVMPRYRHTGTAIGAFGDGHVKSIKKGSLEWYINIYASSVMPPAI